MKKMILFRNKEPELGLDVSKGFQLEVWQKGDNDTVGSLVIDFWLEEDEEGHISLMSNTTIAGE